MQDSPLQSSYHNFDMPAAPLSKGIACTLCWVLLVGGSLAADEADVGSEVKASTGKLVYAVHYRAPEFIVITDPSPGLSILLFGMHGVQLPEEIRKYGQRIQQENRLQDPVTTLKRSFVERFGTKLPDLQIKEQGDAEQFDTTDNLLKRYGPSSVIDFQTTLWQLKRAEGFDLHYFMLYSARSRLVRTGDGRILWEGKCEYTSTDGRLLVDLQALNGALMRRGFATAATRCAAQLWEQFEKSGGPDLLMR